MELHQIRYFLAVERLRSFSRAAQSCNITQPALTRAIQRLEHEFGGKLLHRRPGRIELTELGAAVLPRLQSADREIAVAKSEAASVLGLKRQRLRIGVMCTIGPDRLLLLLRAIEQAMPQIELDMREAKGVEILDAVLSDEVDAAIVGMPKYPEALDVMPLYRERYVLAMANNHRLAGQATIELHEMEGETYIERTNCEFDDHFAFSNGDWPVELNLRYRCAREDWVQAMVTSGLGVAIMPESFPLVAGVVTKSLEAPSISREISFVSPRHRQQPDVIGKLRVALGGQNWSAR